MGAKSAIQWTEASWNPLRGTVGKWTCTKVSPGCTHCYAERINTRFGGPKYVVGADTMRLDEHALSEPARWRKPRMIFVCSMCDLFEERVEWAWLERIFDVMWCHPRHTYQLLTKRPERMYEFIRYWLGLRHPGRPLPEHIWVGTSIESAEYAHRADAIRQIPAAVHWISAEPLLDPYLPNALDLTHIEWLVAGGESGGPERRRLVQPCTWNPHREGECVFCNGTRWAPKPWAMDAILGLQDECETAGTAFLFKQWGGPTPHSGGRLLDGRTWDGMPNGLTAPKAGATS